jgi:hypothetical protein
MTAPHYFWCVSSIVAGLFLLVSHWKVTIYAGIIKRRVRGGPLEDRTYTGKIALICGILILLTYSAMVIIPIYFILRDLMK